MCVTAGLIGDNNCTLVPGFCTIIWTGLHTLRDRTKPVLVEPHSQVLPLPLVSVVLFVKGRKVSEAYCTLSNTGLAQFKLYVWTHSWFFPPLLSKLQSDSVFLLVQYVGEATCAHTQQHHAWLFLFIAVENMKIPKWGCFTTGGLYHSLRYRPHCFCPESFSCVLILSAFGFSPLDCWSSDSLKEREVPVSHVSINKPESYKDLVSALNKHKIKIGIFLLEAWSWHMFDRQCNSPACHIELQISGERQTVPPESQGSRLYWSVALECKQEALLKTGGGGGGGGGGRGRGGG